MELTKKLYAYLLIALFLIVSVMAVTRNSYVDNQYSKHSLSNISNITDVDFLNVSLGYIGANQIATLHDLTAGNITITTELEVRNDEPVTLNRGDPVYFTSYISGLSLQGVEFANNTNTSTHADCIIAETIAAGQRGQCVETGHVIQADTSEKLFGDDLYLDTGGNLTHDKPIFAECIQKIGMVLRAHASQGVIWVNGVDRCNDVPKDINITGNATLNTLFGQWNGSADLISNLLVEDDVGWTNLTKYPAACNTDFFVSGLSDSVTCTTITGFSNFLYANITEYNGVENVSMIKLGNESWAITSVNDSIKDYYNHSIDLSTYIKNTVSDLVNYFTKAKIFTHIGNNITSSNSSMKAYVDNVFMFDTGDNITGNYNQTFGNWTMAENGSTCYGWSCEGEIFYNGSSLVLKVT